MEPFLIAAPDAPAFYLAPENTVHSPGFASGLHLRPEIPDVQVIIVTGGSIPAISRNVGAKSIWLTSIFPTQSSSSLTSPYYVGFRLPHRLGVCRRSHCHFLVPGSFNHVANDIRSPMIAQYFTGVPVCIDSEYLVTESLPNFVHIFEIEVQHNIFIKPQ